MYLSIGTAILTSQLVADCSYVFRLVLLLGLLLLASSTRVHSFLLQLGLQVIQLVLVDHVQVIYSVFFTLYYILAAHPHKRIVNLPSQIPQLAVKV